MFLTSCGATEGYTSIPQSGEADATIPTPASTPDNNDSATREVVNPSTPVEAEEVNSIEEALRELFGEDTAITDSNFELETISLRIQLTNGERQRPECVEAEQEYIDWASSEAQHLSALIAEESSISPAQPPSIEAIIVEDFSTIDDMQEVDSLEVAAYEKCYPGLNNVVEKRERTLDGKVISIENTLLGEGMFDDPIVIGQELSVTSGSMRFSYHYDPEVSFDKDLSLSDDELFKKAGPRLLEVVALY